MSICLSPKQSIVHLSVSKAVVCVMSNVPMSVSQTV